MKIIVIIGPAFPYRGGNSLFVSHLYDSLKDNFDVRIINYKLLYPSFLFPGTTQFDKSSNLIKQAPNERLINSINPFSWINVANKINSLNPDLVVFDWWHPFFSFCHFSISKLLSAELKKRVLFITENVISHESNPIEKILTRIGLNNAKSFLCLSKNVVTELTPFAKGRKIYQSELPVYDCYDKVGINSNEWKEKLAIKPTDKVLLFFGYIRKYKGLDILLHAMKELIAEDSSFKLLVAGEFYDDELLYRDLVKTLGIEENVIMYNSFIANEDVHNFYDVADINVLPYRSGTQSGILNVSYGFGKPVIVTDVGGLAEFVDEGKTGYVIKPESTDDIVSTVKKFYKIKDTTDFAGNISKKLAENSFGKIAELFSTIIEEIK